MLAVLALATGSALAPDRFIVQLSYFERIDQHAGMGLGVNAEAERWVDPQVTVGAFAEVVPFTAYLGDTCGYYDKNCLYAYATGGPIGAVHALPTKWLDLFFRVGVGPAFVSPYLDDDRTLDHWIVTLYGRAAAGADLRLGGFILGIAAQVGGCLHRNGPELGLGLRIGGGL